MGNMPRHWTNRLTSLPCRASCRTANPRCLPCIPALWSSRKEGVNTQPRFPLRIASEDTREYRAEKIVGSRKTKGFLEYKVRWQGYSHDGDTWEPGMNLRHLRKKIQDFKHLNCWFRTKSYVYWVTIWKAKMAMFYGFKHLEKYDQRKIALTFNYKIESQVRIGLHPWPFRVKAFWDQVWVGSGHDSFIWELLLFFF